MGNPYDISGYVGLKDYELLADLSRTQSVICIVDYDSDLRDVARTFYRTNGKEEHWSVSARGTGYIDAFSRQEFLDLCARLDLEFLAPSIASEEHVHP